jgi:hypothetical protein
MSDDYEYDPSLEAEDERPRDGKIDAAKIELMARYFPDEGTGVYYGRQLEIWLEKDFFHWITKKALNELVKEGRIKFVEEKLEHHVAHFYYPRKHRYPRRQIRETISLIAEFSDPTFTRALGHYGELLLDAGVATTGFRIVQKNVKSVDDRRWTETNHDLDRLIERDGIRYGVEVKNQLGYIDQTEFQTKLRMCRYFRVRPMFVARMMPKNYIQEVFLAGGFSLVLGNQHYPLMAHDLAKRVREALALPVMTIQALPDTTLVRFERWHEGHRKWSRRRR